MKIQKSIRILAAVLAIAMISMFSLSVFADDVMLIAENPTEEDIMLIDDSSEEVSPEAMPSSVTVVADIAEVNTDAEVPYILVNVDGEEANQLHLHISEETALIKADGTPIALTDLTKESIIVAYHSTMVTRSLPPQSTAFAVVLLESEEDFFPIYMVAGDRTEDGAIVTEDGNYELYPAEGCEIVPYKTRNIVTLQDINAGTKLLVWADTMTMSIPALVNPTKIMVLPAAVSGTPAASGAIEFIPSEWAKAEVAKADEFGLLEGLALNYQKNITRAEFAKLIVNCVTPVLGLSAEEIVGDNEAQFTDADDVAIDAAALLGIVNGVGDKQFAPEKEITRQEIAVMMHRAINTVSILLEKNYIETATDDLSAYTDAASVADWAKAGVATLAANNVMKGTGEGVLSPLSQTTVEQAILLAARIFDLMK